MTATRTLRSSRLLPFSVAMGVSFPSPRARVSTMRSLTLRLRSEARRESRSFSSAGMRSSTSPAARGGVPLRPVAVKGTANLEARMPTATSLRLLPRAATSWPSRSLSSAGIRTKTSFRTERSDSTEVLSAGCELAPDGHDALQHRQPGAGGEDEDRPRQPAPRREDQPAGDHDDTLGPAAQADVALEPERLRTRPRVADEERARDRRDRQRERPFPPVASEDECDRAEHAGLADAVGGRVHERAEGRALAALARERPVEDVEQRPDDEHDGAQPEEEDLPVLLEVHEHSAGGAERDAERGEGVRRHPRLRQAR